MRAQSFRFRCKRLRRDLTLKLRLSAALFIAGLFSLSTPRESWPRIREAFRTWLRWARDPKPTPFWIYVGRYLKCRRCIFFFYPTRTCGSALSKELRRDGCGCNMETKCGILDADCWAREQGVDESLGWSDRLRRLSGLRAEPESSTGKLNDGRNATTRRCGGCQKRTAG